MTIELRKKTAESSQNWPLARLSRMDVRPTACRCARSSAIVRASHARSSAASHRASSGRSVSSTSASTPTMTAGSPSMRNSHCHPCSPSTPFIFSTRRRDRRADDHGHRRGHHEERARPRALGRRKPVREEQHHAGKEAGFGDAEDDAGHHERPRVVHEHRRHRDESPADHDARDPQPRADTLEDEVARDFEQAVTEEEQARGQAVLCRGEPEFALEIRRDEPDVHPIDVGDDVADERERDEAALHAREDATAIGAGIKSHAGMPRTDEPDPETGVSMSRRRPGTAGRRADLARPIVAARPQSGMRLLFFARNPSKVSRSGLSARASSGFRPPTTSFSKSR